MSWYHPNLRRRATSLTLISAAVLAATSVLPASATMQVNFNRAGCSGIGASYASANSAVSQTYSPSCNWLYLSCKVTNGAQIILDGPGWQRMNGATTLTCPHFVSNNPHTEEGWHTSCQAGGPCSDSVPVIYTYETYSQGPI